MRIKLSHPDCKPHVGSSEAAGMDLRAYFGDRASDLLRAIPPGESLMIDTGVAVEIPEGWVGIVVPRSSLGKRRLMIANTTGVIDSDYRGTIKMNLLNMSNETIIGQIKPDYTRAYLRDQIVNHKKKFAEAWEGKFACLEYDMVMNEDTENTLTLALENGETYNLTGAEIYKLFLKVNSNGQYRQMVQFSTYPKPGLYHPPFLSGIRTANRCKPRKNGSRHSIKDTK